MHNTSSSEYKQMHNKKISWNDNWILIFICFKGRLLLEPSSLSSSSFMTSSFLIQMLKMDKTFFKNWVFHIPHRLRDLIWMVRAWSSVSSIFSTLIMSRTSSYSQSLMKVITSLWHTFLAWMNPMIQGGYSRWPSLLLHSSLLLLPLQVVLDLRDSYDCMVSSFWIFPSFNWFLKVIFQSMFFPSNILVKALNIFGVFREDTCSTSWSMTKSTMIFLALTKFFVCKASSLISL